MEKFTSEFLTNLTPLWENFLRKIPSQSDCPHDLKTLLDSDVKAPFQRFLSQFVFKSNYEVLLANQPTSREKLRVLAVSREYAGKWLRALPVGCFCHVASLVVRRPYFS